MRGRCANCGAERTDDRPGDLCPNCTPTIDPAEGPPPSRSTEEAVEAYRLVEMVLAGDRETPEDPVSSVTRIAPTDAVSASHETGTWTDVTKVLPEAERTVPKGAHVRYFGDYEILKELGRGGMGVVYRARQISLDRLVALKMIRAGHLAEEGERRRFENEGYAVARLDHPGIVPVYEVGEHEGKNYFSMKLIEGDNLARLLPRYQGDPRQTATIVAEIADAVHHAHLRGILHRDLKPANILVDGEGHAHVTDFGLAKRIEGDMELTASGAILGTPAYMSPEQAHGRRGSITTATDLYGVGAILYALLTGRAPFGGFSAIETIEAVRNRAPEPPRRINERVPRDLETICLKCLEKDPSRRYASAQDLAADLRNWLEIRPIQARRVGAPARFWYWCRRRPLVAGLAASLVVAVIVGGAGIVVNWLEVRTQRDLLEAANARILGERDVADSIKDLLINGLLNRANPHGKDVTVVQLLDGIAESVGGDEAGRRGARVEAAIHRVIGDAYRAQGKLDKAEGQLSKAEALRAKLTDGDGDDDERALLDFAIGSLRLAQGRPDRALTPARAALEDSDRRFGMSHPRTLEAACLVAKALHASGEVSDAEAILRRHCEPGRRELGEFHEQVLQARSALALIALQLGRVEEARTEFARLLEAREKTLAPGRIEVHQLLSHMGEATYLAGDPQAARGYLRRAFDGFVGLLGEEHDETHAVRNNLAAVELATGHAEEAAKLIESMAASVGASRHPDAIQLIATLAAIRSSQRNLVEAKRLCELARDRSRGAAVPPGTRAAYSASYAATLAEMGDWRAALAAAQEALGEFAAAREPAENPGAIDCRFVIAWSRIELGEAAKAIDEAKHVARTREADTATPRWRVASARGLVGYAYARSGKREDAETWLIEAYEQMQGQPDTPSLHRERVRSRIESLYEGWPGHEADVQRWRLRKVP